MPARFTAAVKVSVPFWATKISPVSVNWAAMVP